VNRLIRYLALALLVLGLASTPTRADYVFDVTIPASGTGTLDFTITSSDNATLSMFDLGLTISSTSHGTPYFSTTQTDPYSNPNYVFATGSVLDPIPFWTTYPPGYDFPASMSGGDASSLGSVTLSSTPSYLATAQFQVAPAAAPEVVQVTLVNNVSTFFDDLNGSPLYYTASLSGGTVNINVSSVPEPSSLVLAGIAGLGGLFVYGRNRRRSA
jgi:hypothetical protein